LFLGQKLQGFICINVVWFCVLNVNGFFSDRLDPAHFSMNWRGHSPPLCVWMGAAPSKVPCTDHASPRFKFRRLAGRACFTQKP